MLDLNGDGIRLDGAITFDMDVDDALDFVGWANAEDGTLVMDLDGSGAIENGSEVLSDFFNGQGFGSSMEALRSLDTNLDGVVDAGDTAFTDLQVWQDLNSDGVSDTGELSSLAALGIIGISVEETPVTKTIDGQTVFAEGTFFYGDGTTGAYAGVQLTSPISTGTAGDGARYAITADGRGPVTVGAFDPSEDLFVFSAAEAGLTPASANIPTLTNGTAAVGSDAQFVYDQASGTLAWDGDGAGGADAVDVATVDPGTPLTIDDFLFT